MQFKIDPSNLGWWFWLVTILILFLALVGWTAGYYLAISLSLVHVLFFLEESKNVRDFETQLRLTFFVLTLFGIVPGVRVFVFLLLLAETVLIAFFGQSYLARGLKRMRWNQEHAIE